MHNNVNHNMKYISYYFKQKKCLKIVMFIIYKEEQTYFTKKDICESGKKANDFSA